MCAVPSGESSTEYTMPERKRKAKDDLGGAEEGAVTAKVNLWSLLTDSG